MLGQRLGGVSSDKIAERIAAQRSVEIRCAIDIVQIGQQICHFTALNARLGNTRQRCEGMHQTDRRTTEHQGVVTLDG